MRQFCIAMLVGLSGIALAESNSRVDVSKTAKELVFKVIPNDGLVINLEGPWKLEIKDHAGLTVEKKLYDRSTLNEKLTGFQVPAVAAKGVNKGEVSYKLVAFVCTKDKTRCYRDVHDAKSQWQGE